MDVEKTLRADAEPWIKLMALAGRCKHVTSEVAAALVYIGRDVGSARAGLDDLLTYLEQPSFWQRVKDVFRPTYTRQAALLKSCLHILGESQEDLQTQRVTLSGLDWPMLGQLLDTLGRKAEERREAVREAVVSGRPTCNWCLKPAVEGKRYCEDCLRDMAIKNAQRA